MIIVDCSDGDGVSLSLPLSLGSSVLSVVLSLSPSHLVDCFAAAGGGSISPISFPLSPILLIVDYCSYGPPLSPGQRLYIALSIPYLGLFGLLMTDDISNLSSPHGIRGGRPHPTTISSVQRMPPTIEKLE